MQKGLRKTIGSAQVKLRQLVFTFDGGTDTVAGFDRFGIKQVIDLGAGNYTFIFDRPFERECLPSGHCMFTADSDLQIQAVAYDRVTVLTRTAGAAADTMFSLTVMGSDGRFDQ